MSRPTDPPRTASDPPIPVSAVAQMIRSALQRGLPTRLQVVGEISNLSHRTHLFFSLKDEQASLRCVCFASAARRLGFEPCDGQQVVATGRIDFFDGQGSVQLYVDAMHPVGMGPLELKLRQLAEELKAQGYFDPARKRALPLLPRGVAVVTSRTGAALQDVIDTARKRWAGCRLLLMDVRVQGASAAPQIAAAIEHLSRTGPERGIDVVLLTRGGGSLEDLWAFNERIVAQAIFRCKLPVVAAIGHETDTTIAELVADLRCATPTQAAMILVPDADTLHQQLDHLQQRLRVQAHRRIERARADIDRIGRHPFFRQPRQLWVRAIQRVDHLRDRLSRALPQRLALTRQRLHAAGRELQAVGPAQVLRRGYSYTLGPDGRVIRSLSQATTGSTITTVVTDGRFESVVVPVHPPAPPRSTRGRKDQPAASPSLFE